MNASLESEILSELNKLKIEQKRQVLNFARDLALARPTGVAGSELVHFAGTIERDDLGTIARSIEEDCERVDLNEW
jgi:hypothetical protein